MRRTTPLRALAATATLSALVLAGCGGDDPEVEDPTTSEAPTDAEATSAPTDDTAATTDTAQDTGAPADDTTATTEAAGPVTSTDGAFELTLPEGWLDVTSQVEQEVELAVRDDEMTDDFFTNLVVASEEPIDDLEQSIEVAAAQVAGSDGEFEMLDPIEVDGQEALGFLLTRTTSGVPVAQTQWWVEHGDRLYVATFSAAQSQQEATQPLMEELLDSWSWTD
ncbi:DUF1795 domain-containing protein [Ornithinimicrobium sp. F0845]|uniref:DcrB-related protein n=1 Tax=Ornithinimicrobium sp. F0845 TaxID=2926412 RepID=UPI001FF0F455|nr:DcrB-related protein [Ornithinimicrobium sp. F0845]MCK0111089.1 DUF1795 domain-containing protein [Ornithinimicrobium sp. F0845]